MGKKSGLHESHPGKHHVPWQDRMGMEGEGIFVTSLRKDGFGAICSYPKEIGRWLTSEITIPADAKNGFINADARGSLKLEIRDRQNTRSPVFLPNNALPSQATVQNTPCSGRINPLLRWPEKP